MRISIFVLFLAILSACERPVVNLLDESADDEIFGFWRYIHGIDEALKDSNIDLPSPYLKIENDLTLTGFTSTNYINGVIDIQENGDLLFEKMYSTKRADTNWSGAYHTALLASHKYHFENGELQLIGDQTLTYARISECKSAENNLIRFQEEKSDVHEIFHIEQVAECLEITIGYGGGCEPVMLDLVGSGGYDDSSPPQLMVRTILEDHDNCEAYVTERFYFDIEPLKYNQETKRLYLNFIDLNQIVLVNYD